MRSLMRPAIAGIGRAGMIDDVANIGHSGELSLIQHVSYGARGVEVALHGRFAVLDQLAATFGT